MTTTEPTPDVWRRLDDVRSRLLTLYGVVCYIADHEEGPDGVAPIFHMIADSLDREWREVASIVESQPDGGAS